MKNRGIKLLGIGFGAAIVAIDFTGLFFQIPVIQKDLMATTSQLQWIMGIYGLFMATFLITMGRLADHFGRKKFFLIGLLVFGLSSILGGFAKNITSLLVARAFEGISAAMILPISQALIVNLYPESEKSRGMGRWTAFAGLFFALGAVIGGVIVELLSWRYIFFLYTLLSIISFILCICFLSESKEEEKGFRIDYKGLISLFLFVSFLILAIIQSSDWGWFSLKIIALFIGSIIFAFLFVKIENKSLNPIIDTKLFKNDNFLSAIVENFLLIFFIWSSFFLIPLYLKNSLLYSPFMVGITMLFATLPMFFLSHVVGKLYDKIGSKVLILMGFIALLISAFMQTFFNISSNYFYIITAILFTGIGWVFIWPSTMTAAVSLFPTRLAALASGTVLTMQNIGGTLGLAVIGYLFHAKAGADFSKNIIINKITISSNLQDKIIHLLSNPAALQDIVKNLKVFSLVKQAFIKGYVDAIIFLLCVSLIAIIFVSISMKIIKNKNFEKLN